MHNTGRERHEACAVQFGRELGGVELRNLAVGKGAAITMSLALIRAAAEHLERAR
jgi:hypothetical protein